MYKWILHIYVEYYNMYLHKILLTFSVAQYKHLVSSQKCFLGPICHIMYTGHLSNIYKCALICLHVKKVYRILNYNFLVIFMCFPHVIGQEKSQHISICVIHVCLFIYHKIYEPFHAYLCCTLYALHFSMYPARKMDPQTTI